MSASSSTSISDPFLLASYDLPRNETLVTSTHPHVFVSYHKRRVTATVQGDGVHVLDLATLHPAASHTLGPASRFGCASVTRGTNQKSSQDSATTYTYLQSESQIRRWKGGILGKAVEEGPSLQVDYDVSSLYAPVELPSRVLAMSPQGGITLLDEATLATVASHPASSSSLLKTFLFPRREWAQNSSGDGVVVALVLGSDQEREVHLQIISISEDDEVSDLHSSTIPLDVDDCDIADISLTASGHLSLLTTSGFWKAYHLTTSSSSPAPLGTSLRLNNLSFISPHFTSKSDLRTTRLNSSVALLGLTASHVLIVSPSSSPSNEIIFMVWDMKYGVLLAQQSISMPSALAGEKRVRVTVECAEQQAVVVLSPASGESRHGKGKEGKSGKGRSVVLVVPYEVPEKSMIKNALGKGEAGKRWLKHFEDEERGDGGGGMTKREREVLEGKRGITAESVKKIDEEQGETEEGLSYAFVKAIVRRMEERYEGEVLRYLLAKRVVSAGMAEGKGLLEVLREKDDWKAIQLALDNVPDLSENDLVSLLLASSSSPDAISLPALLKHIATYLTSASALRKAIKDVFSTRPEELLKVLEVVEGWVSRWAQKEGRLRMDVADVGERDSKGKRDLPQLEKVLSFLTTLLDATFLSLLAHPPARPLLQRISGYLQPEITFAEATEQLRVPLEPFVKANRDKDKDKERKEEGDWRKRRKEKFERRGVAVGVYQVEELVL